MYDLLFHRAYLLERGIIFFHELFHEKPEKFPNFIIALRIKQFKITVMVKEEQSFLTKLIRCMGIINVQYYVKQMFTKWLNAKQ